MRYKTSLTVNLDSLESNYQALKSQCPNNETIFMVKANAYGHGMVPLVRFAVCELGIKEFGCASLGEAYVLREELQDLQFDIYVFSDTQLDVDKCDQIYLNKRLIPVICSMESLDYYLSQRELRYLPLVLKFNTGMNRLGISYLDKEKVTDKLKKHGINSVHHLLSHFACASSFIDDGSLSALQYSRFQEIKTWFKDCGFQVEKTSMANSGAIEQGFALEESHVRPGLILYGPSSLDQAIRSNSLLKTKNISTLESYIMNSFAIEADQPIGYGATRTPSAGVISIIALGYGDGLPHYFSGTHVYHQGHDGVIFGRVNMDMMQIFFEGADIKDKAFRTGERVTLWNEDPESVLRISDSAKTIPYELFCLLSVRVPRQYR